MVDVLETNRIEESIQEENEMNLFNPKIY